MAVFFSIYFLTKQNIIHLCVYFVYFYIITLKNAKFHKLLLVYTVNRVPTQENKYACYFDMYLLLLGTHAGSVCDTTSTPGGRR